MSKAKVGIVVFPGSNCDHDAYYVFNDIIAADTKFLWHKDSGIGDRNIIILPGGFSYGDYLRGGSIARFSNIMKEVVRFANNGGIVVGICNGFQILCEAGLLPGVLIRNANLQFICSTVSLHVENTDSIFTKHYNMGEDIKVPIAHGEGNFLCSKETLDEMKDNEQILFTYNDNPNGSYMDIAGIQNKSRNIMGMMPHPERASDELLGNTDGRRLLQSIAESVV
jgi:phosphoribosylformylglycinamidine synthase I